MWYFWLSSSRAIVLLPLTSHKKPSCRWRNGSGYQLRCSPVSVSAAWCVRGIFDAANHSPSYFILAIWPFHTLQTSSKLLPIPFRVHYNWRLVPRGWGAHWHIFYFGPSILYRSAFLWWNPPHVSNLIVISRHFSLPIVRILKKSYILKLNDHLHHYTSFILDPPFRWSLLFAVILQRLCVCPLSLFGSQQIRRTLSRTWSSITVILGGFSRQIGGWEANASRIALRE